MVRLTRSQVARRIGRSIATVRKLEGRRLWPEVDSAGVHRFDEDEVDALARAIRDTGRALGSYGFGDARNCMTRDGASDRSDVQTCRAALRDAEARHENWKQRVAEACTTLVDVMDSVDETTLDALDALIEAIDD